MAFMKSGVGFSQESSAVFIDMQAAKESVNSQRMFTRVPVVSVSEKHSPWARWGSNNLLPMEMAEDIGTTGILSGILDGKARFAICNGVLPALVHYDNKGQMVIDKIVMDAEIQDFLADNNHFFHTYGWMKDLCAFANGAARFMLNGARNKVVGFQRDDITEMRYAKMDDRGRIPSVYYSAAWDKVTSPNDERIIRVPLLHHGNPLADLKYRVEKSRDVEFAMTFKYPGWGRKYYSVPLWYAAYLWVKIAQGVPEMKAAMFENNFRPKYMVIISEKYWEKAYPATGAEDVKSWDDYSESEKQEKKNKVYDEIEKYLVGSKNAYKTVFVDGYHDAQTGKLVPEIEIKAIEDPTKSGEYLPDSAAANSEIAFATLFNPSIIGANMPSGPYTNSQGGSNVRESTLIQVIIHEYERQIIRMIFNLIARFNGWTEKFSTENTRLEFLIPATIPTTLDTGSNVKPMITGVSPQ